MCSRVGIIAVENKHSFGRMTGKKMENRTRCERNQEKQGKKQCMCASEKELAVLTTK